MYYVTPHVRSIYGPISRFILQQKIAPEGPGDTIAEGNVGGLEQRRGPRPLRHDHGGCEAGLDAAPGGVELRVARNR